MFDLKNGDLELKASIKSDSYKGIDIEKNIKLKVKHIVGDV